MLLPTGDIPRQVAETSSKSAVCVRERAHVRSSMLLLRRAIALCIVFRFAPKFYHRDKYGGWSLRLALFKTEIGDACILALCTFRIFPKKTRYVCIGSATGTMSYLYETRLRKMRRR